MSERVKEAQALVPFLIKAISAHHYSEGFSEYNHTKYQEQEAWKKFHQLVMQAATED